MEEFKVDFDEAVAQGKEHMRNAREAIKKMPDGERGAAMEMLKDYKRDLEADLLELTGKSADLDAE